MIRLVSTNLDDVSPSALPPAQREGPARLLFINSTFLGFGTYTGAIKDYCAQRDDLDAVHIDLRYSFLRKALGKSLPFFSAGWDQHAYRHLLMWRRVITGWIRGPLEGSRFDAVHFITEGNALSLLDLQRPGDPACAVNIDATWPLSVREHRFSHLATAPIRRLERRMFDASDLIVCRNRWCSESVRDDFGVEPGRILVARNSMRPPSVSHDDMPHREPDALVRLVFVGNDWVRKGGPELLRLHQRAFADQTELHVFSKRAPRDESARNVVWHGRVPREKMLGELLPSMDIFVMPTRQDMHPWAILEAAAVGLPVVSSDLSGIPEMVVHERTGLLCPPDDIDAFERAVRRLLDEPETRRAMGRAGRAHIEAEYDPDRNFNGLLDRLVELADQRGNADSTSRSTTSGR